MKEIVVKLDDDVWEDLRRAAGVRMRMGVASPTVVDEFSLKLIRAIDEGETEKHFQYRNPNEPRD